VNGNIKASRELKVISPAAISGNIDTPVLSVAEGATINGDIKMSGAQSQQTLFSREMLTIDDVAKYLEIDRSLVFEWANNGRLPGTKEGSIWMFERSELDKWVSNEKIN
jgi:excisionase family DNA binding protein